MNTAAKNKSVSKLADELFQLVQEDQGKAFISDGLDIISPHRKLFAVVRGALYHNRIASRKIALWLRQYDEM